MYLYHICIIFVLNLYCIGTVFQLNKERSKVEKQSLCVPTDEEQDVETDVHGVECFRSILQCGRLKYKKYLCALLFSVNQSTKQ